MFRCVFLTISRVACLEDLKIPTWPAIILRPIPEQLANFAAARLNAIADTTIKITLADEIQEVIRYAFPYCLFTDFLQAIQIYECSNPRGVLDEAG